LAARDLLDPPTAVRPAVVRANNYGDRTEAFDREPDARWDRDCPAAQVPALWTSASDDPGLPHHAASRGRVRRRADLWTEGRRRLRLREAGAILDPVWFAVAATADAEHDPALSHGPPGQAGVAYVRVTSEPPYYVASRVFLRTISEG
jgi:hypothetical protein